jgi:hypothetical protein
MGEVVMAVGTLMALSGAYLAQGGAGLLTAVGFVLILLGLGGYLREAIR